MLADDGVDELPNSLNVAVQQNYTVPSVQALRRHPAHFPGRGGIGYDLTFHPLPDSIVEVRSSFPALNIPPAVIGAKYRAISAP